MFTMVVLYMCRRRSSSWNKQDNVQVKLFLSNLNMYCRQDIATKTGIFHIYSCIHFYMYKEFTKYKTMSTAWQPNWWTMHYILRPDTFVLCTLFKTFTTTTTDLYDVMMFDLSYHPMLLKLLKMKQRTNEIYAKHKNKHISP